jgi:hypothetical protein
MEPRLVEVTYINHCGEDDCGLGTAEYNCPWCGEQVTDYEEDGVAVTILICCLVARIVASL